MTVALQAGVLPARSTPTFQLPQAYGDSQFSLWPGYQRDDRTRALHVRSVGRKLPAGLRQEFSSVTLVDQFWSQHHGRPMSEFQIYLCSSETVALHNAPSSAVGNAAVKPREPVR